MHPHAFLGIGLTLSCLTLVGCGVDAIGPRGYASPRYPYRVDVVTGSPLAFLPEPWRLDNYAEEGGRYVEKRGPAYRAMREQDEDGDGAVSDHERYEESLFDLEFVNKRDGSVIWVKAHPIRELDEDLELGVILDAYIDSLGGRGMYNQGTVFSTVKPRTREYMTFATTRERTHIDDSPALTAVIELAELERLKLDLAFRTGKLKIVLTRFGFTERQQLGAAPSKKTPDKDGQIVRKALLVIGYYSAAPHFERSVAEFDAFVSRIHFRG